jgi:protease-4
MRVFIKIVFGSLVASIIFTFLLVMVIIGIIAGAAASSSSKETIAVDDNSMLKITLSGNLVERTTDDPFAKFNNEPMGIGMLQLKNAIEKAASDPKIKGIYLESGILMASMASLEELRNTLLEFKKSKKFIVSYGEYYTEGAYYLASTADRIYMNPGGAMEFNGLGTTIPFFKGALDKLEIKPEVFRVGTYKSAVEPFLLDKMSPANREQTSSFLNSIYGQMVEQMAASRKIEPVRMREISDSFLVQNAKDGVRLNIIDQAAYWDEVEADFLKRMKVEKVKDLNYIDYDDYLGDNWDSNGAENKDAKSKIAVIIAKGEIDGSSSRNGIGSDEFNEQIRKAKDDENVKAVVIRINSPGGSALASDVMWREIQLLRKVKPVIASMGDVAASGGYYMAMGCDSIVAMPTTITGSIGVFGLLFNAQGLMNNKLGVTTDGVGTGMYSDLGNVTREMKPAERAIIQKSVEQIYDEFTSKAAQGRRLTQDSIKVLGGGRVWSGIQAKERGLVDKLGTLDDAIAMAAKKAKLKPTEYRIVYLPKVKTFLEELTASFETKATAKIEQIQFGELYPLVMQARSLHKMNGIQAKLLLNVDMR